MKNFIELLIFQSAICAGASQIALMALPRRAKRSGMEIIMRKKDLLKKLLIGMLTAAMIVPCAGSFTAHAESSSSSESTSSSKKENSSSSDDSEESSSETSQSTSRDTYSAATSTSSFILPAGTWVTPEVSYGQDVYVVLPIVNMFKYNVKDVVITPVVSTSKSEWPFEILQTGYTQKIDVLVGEEACPNVADRVQNVVWAFRAREDVLNGYYKIDYNINYTNPACEVESCTISTFVKTIGKPGAGSVDGDADHKGNISTPRVIVGGFTTEPAEVYAGDTFTLNLNIRNTSKKTAVSNVEITLEAVVEGKDENTYSAFLPTSGSNTIYVDKIPADGSTDIAISLTAKADLVQKPYAMNIKMAYEDADYNAFTSESSVSVPIKQLSKFETSSADVMPSSIEVGQESNVMFSIYNTGKTKLYNVSVRFEGDTVEGGDAFIGPLESGATGNVDVMLTGTQATMDEGIIKAIISYENESGIVTEEEKEITLFVTEPVYEDEMSMEDGMMEEESKKSVLPIVIAIVAAVVVIVIVLIVLLRKKKKKKQEQAELLELEEELKDEE